jgi:hypothetical protein
VEDEVSLASSSVLSGPKPATAGSDSGKSRPRDVYCGEGRADGACEGGRSGPRVVVVGGHLSPLPPPPPTHQRGPLVGGEVGELVQAHREAEVVRLGVVALHALAVGVEDLAAVRGLRSGTKWGRRNRGRSEMVPAQLQTRAGPGGRTHLLRARVRLAARGRKGARGRGRMRETRGREAAGRRTGGRGGRSGAEVSSNELTPLRRPRRRRTCCRPRTGRMLWPPGPRRVRKRRAWWNAGAKMRMEDLCAGDILNRRPPFPPPSHPASHVVWRDPHRPLLLLATGSCHRTHLHRADTPVPRTHSSRTPLSPPPTTLPPSLFPPPLRRGRRPASGARRLPPTRTGRRGRDGCTPARPTTRPSCS